MFTEYRHIHFAHPHHAKGKLKSITIRFDVNHSTGRVKTAWAMCNPKDIFSRELGRFIADDRLAKGEYLESDYIYSLPLVCNAMIQFSNEANRIRRNGNQHNIYREMIDTIYNVRLANGAWRLGFRDGFEADIETFMMIEEEIINQDPIVRTYHLLVEGLRQNAL